MLRRLFVLMISLVLISMPGCLDNDDDGDLGVFPNFSTVADNNETYDNQRMAGSAYIVIFSAEWCSAPCYSTMHAIWEAEPNLPVLVFSTDKNTNPQGITLQDWHEAADQFDDEENETGVNLTTYSFMKGFDAAIELDIKTPGTTVFVDSDGEITYIHQGRMDQHIDLIKEKWAEASK